MRYSFGADEHIFAEVSESMSLESFFKALSYTRNIKQANLTGITEICPANASFQIKYNPDIVHPNTMLDAIKEVIENSGDASTEIGTRIIEIPVYYQDPWTHETLMRFRDRHQDANKTDIEYAAEINGYGSVKDFIHAHSDTPWFVTMVGFVSGLPFLYQMVEREKQIQVPKYVRPRTDTPKLTVGYGGCFSCVYSVRGAGGYQMFGITPMPIFDPTQKTQYLQDFMVFFTPGDIVKWRPIERDEYDDIVQQVKDDSYMPNVKEVMFSLDEFYQDSAKVCKQLKGVLYGN